MALFSTAIQKGLASALPTASTATEGRLFYETDTGNLKRDNGSSWDIVATFPQVDTTNVSNPPTDAELDAAFGTPATVGAGFTAYIDDNNADTNFYQVVSNGTSWWVFTGTKAV